MGIQQGGFDEYNCAVASFHYEEMGYSEDLVGYWIDKCCYSEQASVAGCLGGDTLTTLEFTGDCNYESILATATDYGCSKSDIFAYLIVGNESSAVLKANELCSAATEYAHNNFYKFSDIAKAGYQFDREFMNGGSDWNNMLNPDLSRIQKTHDLKKGITFPDYLVNFESCESQAVMCCWTADSSDVGDGSCLDPAGCQDADPVDNTDICYVDITNSPRASHTAAGIVAYPGDSEGPTNCMGFTWKDDEISDLYKGNFLFEVAMNYGLMQNGYTRSVPHAPMCACVEQMPVVSNADCKEATVTDSWSFAPASDDSLLGKFISTDKTWSAWFSEEAGGYSELLNTPFQAMKCSGGHCDNQRIYSGNDDIFVTDGSGTWTDWFSDERPTEMPCPHGTLIQQIQCSGGHCDNKRLLCTALVAPYQVSTQTRVTPWFSSSTSSPTFCPHAFYAYGLQCRNHHCGEMRIFCKGVGEQIALINLWQSSADLTFNDCGGADLATHYETVHPDKSISNYINGDCAAPTTSFLSEKANLYKDDSVNWVKVAGKGSFAEPDNPKHVEQFHGSTLTSYSREDFEALWANSNQILLRICKNCAHTHQFVYLKRHDTDGLPSNVDLLNDVKSNWFQYENNYVHEDFDLYSTYDDAIQGKYAWQKINSDYGGFGFARDSGPYVFVYNQWNVWETPLHGQWYGQTQVAFYVAMPASVSS